MASESLRGENILHDSSVSDRLDYLAFLDEDNMSDDDRDLWADEIEELKDLTALVAAVGLEFGSLISEDYWKEYASEDADDSFDLQKTGAWKYFDYEEYADDLQTDYSLVKFGDTTYYYQG